MPERPKRFPPGISRESLKVGSVEYLKDCPAGSIGNKKHHWGRANTFTKFGRGRMAGHVSTLECSMCHKVIHISVAV